MISNLMDFDASLFYFKNKNFWKTQHNALDLYYFIFEIMRSNAIKFIKNNIIEQQYNTIFPVTIY